MKPKNQPRVKRQNDVDYSDHTPSRPWLTLDKLQASIKIGTSELTNNYTAKAPVLTEMSIN